MENANRDSRKQSMLLRADCVRQNATADRIEGSVTYPPGADLTFTNLYVREHERVFQVVYALCGNYAIAEDATQEAFARALERWGRLQDQPGTAGWVTTTALNTARRVLRRQHWLNLHRFGAAEPLPSPDISVDLWQTVRRLPRRQQEAVALHYLIDLPVVEVARLMGCREGTVKAHLARARDTLRGQLEVGTT